MTDFHPLETVESWAAKIGVTIDQAQRAIRMHRVPFLQIGSAVRLWSDQPWVPEPDEPVTTSNEFPPDLIDALRGFVATHGFDQAVRHLRNVAPPRKPISESVRRAVIARDGRTCRYCLTTIGPRTRFHLDHVVPHVAGGLPTVENLVVCCMRCNHAKLASPGGPCPRCGILTWFENSSHHRVCVEQSPSDQVYDLVDQDSLMREILAALDDECDICGEGIDECDCYHDEILDELTGSTT